MLEWVSRKDGRKHNKPTRLQCYVVTWKKCRSQTALKKGKNKIIELVNLQTPIYTQLNQKAIKTVSAKFHPISIYSKLAGEILFTSVVYI